MLVRFPAIICLLLLQLNSHAQDTEAYVDKEFVIILSSPDYNAALRTAKDAAAKLELKLDLRDLQKNKTTGLSFSKNICENEWDEYPCYVARGRYDDGNYVSIEYSDAYSGFTKGYYIVIIAGAEKGSSDIKSALAKAKTVFKNAYSKSTKVYVGCMH
jgi:hypothetical protein